MLKHSISVIVQSKKINKTNYTFNFEILKGKKIVIRQNIVFIVVPTSKFFNTNTYFLHVILLFFL